MALVPASQSDGTEFVIEDLITGLHASGFGRLGDGRSFSFHVHHGQLVVEVYRPRRAVPVPLPEDVTATATRGLAGVDVDDARSLSAAVRDAVAAATPVR
ncbi:MAG: hypothetical protein ACKOQ4_06785 [Mycobacterium sp.]